MTLELQSNTDENEAVSDVPDLDQILKTDVHTSELVLPFHLNKDIVFLEDGKARLIENKTKLIPKLLEFANLVFRRKELPYRIDVNKRGIAVVEARRLADYIKLLPTLVRLKDRDLALVHDADLILEEYRKHPISLYRWLDGCGNSIEFAKLANGFIEHLRVRAKETKLVYRMSQWMRNADENAKKLKKYFKWMVGKTAHLVCIRIDLHLRKGEPLDADELDNLVRKLLVRKDNEHEAFMMDREPDEVDFGDDRVSFYEISDARTKYIDAVRHDKKLKKGLVGFIWSIEFASIEGFHCHAAFFYDHSIINGYDHLARADALGAKWIRHTKGAGYFFSCNRKKYNRPACGIVEYSDSLKLSYLWSALLYLVKKTQLCRVKSSGKAKTFGSGLMIDKKTNGRTGRPRSKPDGLANINFDSL